MDNYSTSQLRLYAMNLLARREYTQQELRHKLSAKSSELDLVNEVIAKLGEEGLQSDERFTEAFTRMRLRQGKGARLVGLELQQKGVASYLIEQSLSDEAQWREALSSLVDRRFSGRISTDSREKAKQLRYLQSRGFTYEQIQSLLRPSELD